MKNSIKNLAIATTNNGVYSETFIKAQIDHLNPKLVMYGGWLPAFYGKSIKIVNSKKEKLNIISKIIFKRKFFDLSQEYVSLIKSNKIDVVLAQYGPGGVHLNSICKAANIDLIVHFHGFDASDFQTLKTYEDSYKALFQDAKKIIAVSKVMQDKLVTIGCPLDKIKVITYGPNNLFFNIEPKYNCETFFALGRFIDKKAPYLTILSFNEVLKKFPNAKLRMAGNGELLNTCKNMVKALQITDSVTFLGVIHPEQTIKEMENAIAFVQHSLIADDGDSEGSPVAVLEAQAAGLPVISTFHAGIPEVVLNNETGFLVIETDIYGMADAMLKILQDKKLAQKMGQAGRQRVLNNFSMEHYINSLRAVINE